MTEETPYDFTSRRGLDSRIEAKVGSWFEFFSKSPVRLQRVIGTTPQITPEPIALGALSELVAAWAEPMVGCTIKFGPEATTTLLAIPATLANAIVSLMLGIPLPEPEAAAEGEGGEAKEGEENPDAESEEEAPAPARALTRVERSMMELLVGEICLSLVEAWPESDPPHVAVGEAEPDAAQSRFVAKTAPLVCIPFTMSVGNVSGKIDWMLPPDAVAELGEGVVATPTAGSRRNLETLMHGVPVELVVKLGEAKVFLRDLARLKSGDLIVLDTKLGQPLRASIGEHSQFLGWPGRVGSQQAYQVDQLVKSGPVGGPV